MTSCEVYLRSIRSLDNVQQALALYSKRAVLCLVCLSYEYLLSRLTCQLIGIIMAPAALFAHRTPSSFSAVLRKYCVESPSEMTRARMMSPGHSDVDTSALSTSVARMSCTSVGRARAVCWNVTARQVFVSYSGGGGAGLLQKALFE